MVYCAYYVLCALNGRYVSWLPGAQVKCWMLLTVYTLPQLAVSAKILCLLMVVISGALPSMVRSVRLYSMCSHHFVNIHRNGTVMAWSNDANLTLSSQGFDLKLLIHSPRENMYLCFNRRWKLVGRRISRQEALSQKHCLFWESMLNGYNTYSSVANATRYLGFNVRGQQLRRPLPLMPQKRHRCIKFIKEDKNFDINKHNNRVGLGGAERRPQHELRLRHRPPQENMLETPIPDNMRHSQRQRHRRRKFDDTT